MRQMKKRYIFLIYFVLLLCVDIFVALQTFSQDGQDSSSLLAPKKLNLDRAAMCEAIKDFKPDNSAVVFSITIGTVSCFTSFDVVTEETFNYHKWFQRDKTNTEKRLTLQTPEWSYYTSIQLRETDKGPWRVEIWDQSGNLLHTLRFSITN